MTTATPGTSLTGRIALVTGAGGGAQGGIGAGIARCLGLRGAAVCVNDISDETAQRTVDWLTDDGIPAFPVVGNVADSDDASAMIGRVEREVGPIDVLVNNAGIVGRSSVLNTTDDEWSRVLRVNLDGPFVMSRAVLPHMRSRQHGRIVNISSIAGTRTSYLGGIAYTSSKSGLLGLTRHLAAEVAQYGITVNAILPGITMTPLVESATTEESIAAISQMVPSGRVGRPADIGWTVCFLASDEAGYVSGTAVPVDGALTVLPGDFSGYRTNSGKDVG
ncbi:SDR family NAD(P)-dependent oxidoreductase [Gordonia rhizosphera]|uniref:3-oxoacyl-[acyl-carrier-protein] reductase MabA n=1 Tax=Gordonia rhizosphera NBRC 16068 TaxID=1108045 RepID=K6X2E5_9ACTN|nr:SDR family NAD(P)-dependent oxidoreductase [Gordonia rhizosphera]GAB92969.1 3-oxoacyl-[acyl-carrier-protein] reductase [Gordonia rhizosphera NBRC 16068]